MDSKRAAEVLRQALPLLRQANVQQALDLGAQALEAWAWVGKEEHNVMCNIKHKRWEIDSGVRIIGFGPTPLAAVLDAMEQEGKG
jgi:hypothetical protein